MCSRPVSVLFGSAGRVGISKKRSVSKEMLSSIPVVFPETLEHINSVSVWVPQAFGGYQGGPVTSLHRRRRFLCRPETAPFQGTSPSSLHFCGRCVSPQGRCC